MKQNRTYGVALFAALSLHVALVMMLVMKPSTEQPVMALDMKQDMKTPAPEIVKAVSVNSEEVKAVVERLKTERETARKAEEARKQEVVAAAARARTRRIKEEARLKHLKQEQAALLAKQKRAAREEQQRVSELKNQKEMELRKLAAMKREQEVLKKKQVEAEAEAREVARLQNEEEKARREAAQRARMAGVVDKYKALILGAIGQQWILPDQVNTSLSSRFKIRLAPNGAVLDVQLTRSSGDAVLDRSAEAAIYKASPLPVPSEPDMFNVFREISLTVRPETIRG
jgi:colicin import membrane protein